MLEKYNENSNDKKQIDIFLNFTLSKLGLNHANLGTRYFKEIIKLAYFNNFTDVKYKDLCSMLSKQLNVSIRKINSNIYNSINSIDIALAKKILLIYLIWILIISIFPLKGLPYYS